MKALYTIDPLSENQEIPSFHKTLVYALPLEIKGNRSMQMTFEHPCFEHPVQSVNSYHLEEHSSGRHLLTVLEKNDFAKNKIAPPDSIKKNSFSEAVNRRGLRAIIICFLETSNQFLSNLVKGACPSWKSHFYLAGR